MGIGEMGVSTVESDVSTVASFTGTISNFQVYEEASNFNGTFTVRVNGVDTAITCTVSAAQRCSDTSHTASITAGQSISIHCTGVPSNAKPTHWRADITVP
jgi:hypothetical protein